MLVAPPAKVKLDDIEVIVRCTLKKLWLHFFDIGNSDIKFNKMNKDLKFRKYSNVF